MHETHVLIISLLTPASQLVFHYSIMIGLGEAVIVSLFVECVLYGFFLTMFTASIFIIMRRRNKATGKVNTPMLLVAVSMFILATVHVGTDFRHVLDAYIYYPEDKKYLGRVNNAIYIVKSTSYCIQTLIGDGFMLYRLHMVWQGDKRVVLPIGLCFVASIGVGIGALQGFARASPDAPVFIKELHDWITSFFSLTLFTNFSSTLLIAVRIWWIRRQAGGVTSVQGLMRAAIVIVESGAIYSACLVILLCLYLSKSFAQYILLDAVTQVIGIVFSLIIIRVAMGIASDAGDSAGRPSIKILSSFFAVDKNMTGVSETAASQGESHCMQPTLVHVSTTVTADRRTMRGSDDGSEKMYRYSEARVVSGSYIPDRSQPF